MIPLSSALRNLIVLIVLIPLVILVVLQTDSLNGISSVMANVRYDRLSLGVLMFGLTFILSSLNYSLLVLKPVRVSRLLVIQIASGFANKLMPAGLGSMTLNARYLTRSGHNTAQAIAVASTNNLIGILGHAALLVIALPGLLNGPLPLSVSATVNKVHVLIVCIVLAIGTWVILGRWGRKIVRIAKQSTVHVKSYRSKPKIILISVVLSLGITGAYVITLQACVQAVGSHIQPGEALLALSAGLLGTSVMPTPGGAGGAEAGIALILSGFGLPATLAVSSALLYRLMTFWLPLIPGFVVFEWLQLKKQLF
ncbi:MAG: lysylphosphatidylglycerol synthase transmembrane domain-containing protein [Patescibacteria group bacterium]